MDFEKSEPHTQLSKEQLWEVVLELELKLNELKSCLPEDESRLFQQEITCSFKKVCKLIETMLFIPSQLNLPEDGIQLKDRINSIARYLMSERNSQSSRFRALSNRVLFFLNEIRLVLSPGSIGTYELYPLNPLQLSIFETRIQEEFLQVG